MHTHTCMHTHTRFGMLTAFCIQLLNHSFNNTCYLPFTKQCTDAIVGRLEQHHNTNVLPTYVATKKTKQTT